MGRDALKRGEPRNLVGTPRGEGLGWSWLVLAGVPWGPGWFFLAKVVRLGISGESVA